MSCTYFILNDNVQIN